MEDELLIRFLNKHCSADEEKQVHEWLALDKANREQLFELEKIWALKSEMHFSDKEQMQQAYQRLSESLNIGKQREMKSRFTMREWLKYAAILIVASLLAVNLVYINKEEPTAYNTVVVPKGQRVSLLLSDGTTVWLNAESSFSYPTQFSKENRKVKLEGEGYFEVAHNPASPFTVELQMLNVRVLGTKFNVKAYRDEPCWVTLKEGSVEVSTADNTRKEKLAPNDQAYYSANSGLVLYRNQNVTSTDLWTTGDLKFDNRTLKDIAHVMERRYDVKIKFMDEALETEFFTCHFRKDLTIGQALELLKETRRVHYKMEKRMVYLYKN